MSSVMETLLRIQPAEVCLARRGFRVPGKVVRARLEHIGETFLQGYHAALSDCAMEVLVTRLEAIDLEFRGFGYEGAAMALDLLDHLTPWKPPRVPQFLSGPAEPHTYMAIVGIGWSMARLSLGLARRLSHLDPLLRWLAFDGWGFHEGYFHWPRYAGGNAYPRKLSGYALRVFDQGLGRSMWFIGGADPEAIRSCVVGFPDSRRGDLWSGIGLACTYAGGAEPEEIIQLRGAAESWWPHLAQGSVFAAKARERAENPTEHTDQACRLLTGLPAIEAAALSDLMLSQVGEGPEPAYERWRVCIRKYLLD
jgi:hypothetical protein